MIASCIDVKGRKDTVGEMGKVDGRERLHQHACMETGQAQWHARQCVRESRRSPLRSAARGSVVGGASDARESWCVVQFKLVRRRR